MIIWLDDGPFPPSKETLANARDAGASQVVSRPWPKDYDGFKSGAHDLGEPDVVSASFQGDQPITWAQLHSVLSGAQDLSAVTDAVAAVIADPGAPAE